MKRKTIYLWLFFAFMVIVTALTYNKRHTEKKAQAEASMTMDE